MPAVLPKRAPLSAGAAAALPGIRRPEAQTPRSRPVLAAQTDDLAALDRQHSVAVTGSDPLRHVHDQPFTLDPTKDVAELQPGIAEVLAVAADGRSLTVRIRRGVRVRSGNPLTPADVPHALRRPRLIDRTPAFTTERSG